MRSLEVGSQSWFLADAERTYPASQSDIPPNAGELFLESAIALAVPLFLALAVQIWLPTAVIPVPQTNPEVYLGSLWNFYGRPLGLPSYLQAWHSIFAALVVWLDRERR